jgi:two-component system, LuxR family, response regulator FixJ
MQPQFDAEPRTEPTVFVVDDDVHVSGWLAALLLRNGLRSRVFDSSRRFLDEFDAESPGCILLDLRLPEINGLGVLEELRRRRVETPVVLLSGAADVNSVARAMRCGAVDFMEKTVPSEQLIARVRESIARDAELRSQRADARRNLERIASLTPRELDVVERLALGEASKSIAIHLGISKRTVDHHREAALRKTGASNAVELAQWFARAREDRSAD